MKRRTLALLSIAGLLGCRATAPAPEVVGPWMHVERGRAIDVAARLDEAVGKPPRAWNEKPRRTERAEIDADANAVRWRGTEGTVRLAASLLPACDVPFDDADLDAINARLRYVSLHFACDPGRSEAACRAIRQQCTALSLSAETWRCDKVELFRCTSDPATATFCLEGCLELMLGSGYDHFIGEVAGR